MDHRISLGITVLGIGKAEHIHLDARRDQSDDRMHVSCNAGRRVRQRDRRPNRVDMNDAPRQERERS